MQPVTELDFLTSRKHQKTIRNYYAKWGAPVKLTQYLLEHYDELERLSRSFSEAFYGSTLPEPVLDAVASTLTVIRSNTCFRTEDGRFFAFEGCFDQAGCCDGNCTHVWSYAQTLAYLFPELERSMRQTEFCEEMQPDGAMNFRAQRFLSSAFIIKCSLVISRLLSFRKHALVKPGLPVFARAHAHFPAE